MSHAPPVRAALHLAIGWTSVATGIVSGMLLGMWSFDGPLPSPIGEYGDVSRRLIRLGHIAFVGLGILNLLMARDLPRSPLRGGLVRLASVSMNLGNVLLPVLLVAAGLHHPLKYLLPIPVCSVAIAVILVAGGAWRGANETKGGPA